ncbi:MAG: hypothetical protein Q9221_006240 [Calogaya cf. arnoldii]
MVLHGGLGTKRANSRSLESMYSFTGFPATRRYLAMSSQIGRPSRQHPTVRVPHSLPATPDRQRPIRRTIAPKLQTSRPTSTGFISECIDETSIDPISNAEVKGDAVLGSNEARDLDRGGMGSQLAIAAW